MAAVNVIIAIIPIVGIVMGSAVIFFYLLWIHRRRTLLIKAGQYKRSDFDLYTFCLLTGLLLGSTGTMLTVFLALIADPGYGLLGGLIPLSIGIGLLAFCGIKRHSKVK